VYLGMTSQGVTAIGADWPTYPREHGTGFALAALGMFPPGSRFRPIADVDGCALLVATDFLADAGDPFSERNLHVAMWHDDLLAAADRGWIEGVSRVDGALSWTGDPVLLTGAGDAELEQVWLAELVVPDVAKARVQPLIDLAAYDTAIREIGVLLETTIHRALPGADHLYGVRLGEAFVEALLASDLFVGSGIKSLRGEIRTVFKFVRNRFAHNAVDLSHAQGLALISRSCRLLDEVHTLASALLDEPLVAE
jgi:hypothetical protein